jgi:circadian clock protein KaiC
LEEYVSDCVILLEHRTVNHVSTRNLRVVKYRGSSHGTNEYPFLIDVDGISVLPITSTVLDYPISDERVSSGVSSLDDMLEGEGYYRGSSILVSGTAGTGKTSLAASFAQASCLRGERCLYLSFEEATNQIVRNMQSIGLDLQPLMEQKLLKFHPVRPTMYGLEMHLATIHKLVENFQPQIVIIDPITTFLNSVSNIETHSMLTRLIDYLKTKQITALFTGMTSSGSSVEPATANISSIIDTWLLLRDLEVDGERNRVIYILKARGIANSNQIREFLLTSNGIELKEVQLGLSGVLTGSARLVQEARERFAEQERQQEQEQSQLDLERKRKLMENNIAMLRAEFEAEETETHDRLVQAQSREKQRADEQSRMKLSRKASDVEL